MAHGLDRLRTDVSITFGRDAEWDRTPALGVFDFLNRFDEAGNDNECQRAEPSTSFRRSPRVTSNGSCTRSCRPKKEGGVERSVPIAVFPILADPVDVKKGDQLCKTVSQPSIQPEKVDPPMGS